MLNSIDISFFQKNLFKLNLSENKKLISIIDWLELILKEANFSEKVLMPKKKDLAKLLNVGTGTIQNAYRFLEDKEILISKQCIGTFYIPFKTDADIKKSVSKKLIVLNNIKSYFLLKNLKVGNKIGSVRFYAKKMKVSSYLILQIFEQLEHQGIIENIDGTRFIKSVQFDSASLVKTTLIDTVYNDIKKYISSNCKQGDKLPSLYVLSEKFSVSLKTVHSAVQKLQKEGILKTLSGRYGTVILRIPNESEFYVQPEISIFATAKETYFYRYEKILSVVKKMIYNNFSLGSKLPSISELSLMLDVNANTIRKIFNVLKKEGIVASFRGRYGGTFVTDIPDLEDNQAYRWLAVTTEFSV